LSDKEARNRVLAPKLEYASILISFSDGIVVLVSNEALILEYSG
jgi:hypothetical protein